MSTTYYDGTVVFRNGGYTDLTTTVKLTTTDDAPRRVYSIVMPSTLSESYVIECRMIGYTATGPDVYLGYTIMANNDMGTIVVYGGDAPVEYPMMLIRDGAVVTDTCLITTVVDSGTVNFLLTGLPTTVVKWAGTIRVHRSIHE